MLDSATPTSTGVADHWPVPSRPAPRPFDDVVAAGVLLDVSRLLGGLLGLVRPALGARTEYVARLVKLMTRELRLERPWEFEVAARLSLIGWLTVPSETHDAAWRGERLKDDDWLAVASHPLVARDLLADVSRLDGAREMIARQREPFAVPGDVMTPVARRDRLMLGGHILRVCGDYVSLMERRIEHIAAIDRLSDQPLEYDLELVEVLDHVVRNGLIRPS